jgi:hypothetical protein
MQFSILETKELKEAGIEELLPTSKVQITQCLKPIYGTFNYQLTQFQFASGIDIAQSGANDEQKVYVKQLAKFIVQNVLSLNAEDADNRFILIGIDRLMSSSEREAKRDVVPQTLCLQLYDAKESREIVYRNRWKLW